MNLRSKLSKKKKFFISSDKIVRIEEIIYALKYNFNLIFLD